MDLNIALGYHPIGQNYGYLIDKAPQNVLEELGRQINELQSDFSKGIKFNDVLAGEIENEYKILPQSQTIEYIKDLTQRFENESQYIISNYTPLPTLQFNDLWINFQKKHEYNPIHNHNGEYSFVIWYQVPYTFKNELRYSYKSNEAENCKHGLFQFITPSPFDSLQILNIISLPIDKSKEGYVAIFPSNLQHQVYPFYSSDEYRITIAGNINSNYI